MGSEFAGYDHHPAPYTIGWHHRTSMRVLAGAAASKWVKGARGRRRNIRAATSSRKDQWPMSALPIGANKPSTGAHKRCAGSRPMITQLNSADAAIHHQGKEDLTSATRDNLRPQWLQARTRPKAAIAGRQQLWPRGCALVTPEFRSQSRSARGSAPIIPCNIKKPWRTRDDDHSGTVIS